VTTINLLCLFKDHDNVFAAGKAATGSLSPIPYLNHFEWVLQSALDFSSVIGRSSILFLACEEYLTIRTGDGDASS